VASIHNTACLLLLRAWVVLDAMVKRMSIAMSNLNNEQNDIGSCDGWNEDPTVLWRPALLLTQHLELVEQSSTSRDEVVKIPLGCLSRSFWILALLFLALGSLFGLTSNIPMRQCAQCVCIPQLDPIICQTW
jgi:hypothetical protein